METKEAADVIKSATSDVFGTMLSTTLKAGDVIEDETPFFQSEVTALIGIAGGLTGYVSVHCNDQQARSFTARFLGMDENEVESTDDIRDAMGELVNMIAGNVKTLLNGAIEISLPTVVMTPKPDMRVKGAAGVLVPFDDPTGTFHVEMIHIRR